MYKRLIYKDMSFFKLIQPEDGNCNVFQYTGTASAGDSRISKAKITH
jgi:hypothetical protein